MSFFVNASYHASVWAHDIGVLIIQIITEFDRRKIF